MGRPVIHYLFLFVLLAAVLSACRSARSVPSSLVPVIPVPTQVVELTATPFPPLVTEPTTSAAVATATIASSTPIFVGQRSAPCGVLLPALPTDTELVTTGKVSQQTHDALRAQAPPSAWPALQRLLDLPGSAGLVAYQAGRESEGVFLNADIPMPLASVAKIITLVAYVEAVEEGELNPLEQVPLSDLDRYYLPNFDLGAHRRALTELRAEGRILSPDENPAVLLSDVPWMMIRHSSNAAADYLHLRLGQERIEATATMLTMNTSPANHTAPCTFLGQFLMMANHTRGSANDRALLTTYTNAGAVEAERYGSDVSLLADAYVQQSDFREAERAWRSETRRPTIETQRYFADRLAPQGTAGDYAAIMFRLAQNGLSSADSSFQARRYLEWPNLFPVNQELFSNVGYKNGSLPGVLTTAYYAYRWGDAAPVIVVLFFRDLPQGIYRQWRFDLPHDELGRWLLADPAAIPALSAALRETTAP